jgi:hypothetical protein
VDDASVPGVHGLKADHRADANRSFRLFLGPFDKLTVVTLSVITGVDDDMAAAAGEAVDDLVHQELQSVEGLTLPPDGAAGVLAADVEDDLFPVISNADVGIQIHSVQNVEQGVGGIFGFAVPGSAFVEARSRCVFGVND